MTTEKKLEYFIEAINKEVETKKRHARHQLTASANDEVTQAVTLSSEEANTQTQAQLHAIQKIMNKRITAAKTESRRALATLKERLIAQLFDQIKADVVAFTESPEYEIFLIDNAKASQSRHPFAFIQLTPKDMHLADAIQKATGLVPEQGDETMLGGFKLLTENLSKGQEHTLSGRITDARQRFSEELNLNKQEDVICQKANCVL